MSLNVTLSNKSAASAVYAFVHGSALTNNNALFFLQADGVTPFYPSSPTTNGSPIPVDVAINLGSPGTTRTITIPPLGGGRIYFSYTKPLQFFLNPGPGLVTPSVTNASDANYNLEWDFMEFTYGNGSIFANISYVDFVGLPIALTLTDSSNNVQHVSGYPIGARITLCNQLRAQAAADGSSWGDLVINGTGGPNLRALSPNSALSTNPNLFPNYFTSYVNQVWSRFTSSPLTVDTQASFGNVEGRVVNNLLTFPNGVTFSKPTTADIFSNSTGPFAINGPEAGTIVPRLAAAFNRTTLLAETETPSQGPTSYYKNNVTNYYAKFLHSPSINLDGLGYAFPYDDVTPSGGVNQSGSVTTGAIKSFVVTVGGVGASAS